jgi:hypothetical protein
MIVAHAGPAAPPLGGYRRRSHLGPPRSVEPVNHRYSNGSVIAVAPAAIAAGERYFDLGGNRQRAFLLGAREGQ